MTQQADDALQGIDPQTGKPVGDPVPATTPADVDAACRAAADAAQALADWPLQRRAALLHQIAATLRDAGDQIVPLADAESGLGTGRLEGELVRTWRQLQLFAAAVAEGSLLEAVVDLPDPTATPAPRPDIRRMLRPIGPVAVFAASNFPLAFSVAGGDTASALAAGCPVVVKAHPGHPGLSALVGRLVADAVAAAGAPPGTFAVVHGHDAGIDLVRHPAIKAVGFTGSLAGGRALHDLCAARPDPIPFYGELGSLNPVVVTEAAVAARGDAIARGFVASYTMGAGQFCTKPGLLFLPAGHGLEDTLTAAVTDVAAAPLLTERLRDTYDTGVTALADQPGVRPLAAGGPAEGPGWTAQPALYAVDATTLAAAPETLLDECFGPVSVIVTYQDTADLHAALAVLPGSLTAGLHAEATDTALAAAILDTFTAKAGRVLYNGWPTGVAVTWAMHHGGPWPATTAPLHTSVGVTAVRRFQRPVAYQDVPDALLPPALRDANPHGIPRRVDGDPTTAATTHP